MKRLGGFTLIELTVSATLLTMLAAAGFAAFHAGTSSWQRERRRTAMAQTAEIALSVIVRDLRAIVAPGKDPDTEAVLLPLVHQNVVYEDRDCDTLDIITATNRPSLTGIGQSDACEVGYYIDNDPDTEVEGLVRRKDAVLDDSPLEGGVATPLGEAIRGLDFQFHDGTTWYEEWTDLEQLPVAIHVTIVVIDPDGKEIPRRFGTTVRLCTK